MDNFQFWLYVIIAVIYVISKAIKKSNRQKQEQVRPPARNVDQGTSEESESLPPMSFEELLREITEGKKKQRQHAPPPPPQPKQVRIPPYEKPKPAFVDYDDDIEPEVTTTKRVNYDEEAQETTRQVYEKAQREASLRSSLETLHSDITGGKSTLKSLESSLGRTGSDKFEPFRAGEKHRLVAEYLRELKTPSGMKKAVIFSEILKPKF